MDTSAVHLDAHLLAEVHLKIAQFEGYRFSPGGRLGVASVVGDANRESVIVAIGDQLVFAGALEAEEFAVKRFVVRIAENGAGAGA